MRLSAVLIHLYSPFPKIECRAQSSRADLPMLFVIIYELLAAIIQSRMASVVLISATYLPTQGTKRAEDQGGNPRQRWRQGGL